MLIKSLLPFLASAASLVLGAFSLVQSKTRLNRLFSILCFFTCIWQGVWACLFCTTDAYAAYHMVRFGYMFVLFLPTFLYHFLSIVAAAKKELVFIKSSYVLDGIFFVLLWTTSFVIDGLHEYGWGYYPKAGSVHFLHVIQTIVVISRGLFLIFRKIVTTKDGNNKRKLVYVFAGIVICFFAALDYLCTYGISFYPPGAVFVLLALLFMSYAVLKYQLFEIRVLNIRVLSLVHTSFLIVFSVFLVYPLMELTQIGSLLLMSLLSLFWAFSGQKILHIVQTPLEKKFFRGHYDVEKIIIQLSQTLVYMNDKNDIFKLIVNEFVNDLETKNSYYIYRESNQELFHLVQSRTGVTLAEFSPTSPLLTFFSGHGGIKSLEKLPKDVRDELLGMPFLPGSLFFSIHSIREGLQGIIIIGPKLNQGAFTTQDYNFLRALSNQILVVFERISFREKLEEANRKLKEHKDELEHQVRIEVQRSKELLEAAQVLSRQAALANLTKGIAHEIKNPINNMKINVHAIRDDIEQMNYLNVVHENETWKGRVSLNALIAVCNSNKYAADIFSVLLEKGYIDSSGRLTELFRPQYLDFVFELPSDLKTFEHDVDIYLRHTLIKKRYWLLTETLDEEFNRITRITSSMLQYGATGTGVTNTAFSDIMSFGDSSMLWDELVNNGYLNASGFVEEKFNPSTPGFGLDISDYFKPFEASIISIILNNPYALKNKLDVNSLIRDVSNICSGRFSKDYIKYEECLREVPMILGSRDALKQCLINIFDNSVDALLKKVKNERSLFIQTECSLFKNSKNKFVEGVCISIKDTGCGISKEDLSKIRDPFFTTKSKTGGQNAGLGMPFVYQTVEGHNGRISIESDEGVGTCLYLYFAVV